MKALLDYVNNLHANFTFKFTHELSGSDGLSFLDMKVSTSSDRTLKKSWHKNMTDTNVYMNFLSLAPQKYRAAIFQVLVRQLSSISSSWKQFDSNLTAAKSIVEAYEYPPSLYNPLIHRALNIVIDKKPKKSKKSKQKPNSKKMWKLECRVHHTCWFKSSMKNIEKCSALIIV